MTLFPSALEVVCRSKPPSLAILPFLTRQPTVWEEVDDLSDVLKKMEEGGFEIEG